jgi:hypothetical protein
MLHHVLAVSSERAQFRTKGCKQYRSTIKGRTERHVLTTARASVHQGVNRREFVVSTVSSISASSLADRANAATSELSTRDQVSTPGSSLQAQLDRSVPGARINLPGKYSDSQHCYCSNVILHRKR